MDNLKFYFHFTPEVFYGFGAVTVLIVADVLLGILQAVAKNEFDLRKLPQFLKQNVLPYLGGLGILAVASLFSPVFAGLFIASAGATAIKFLADLKDKVAGIFGRRDKIIS